MGIWVVGDTFLPRYGEKEYVLEEEDSVLNLLCLKHLLYNRGRLQYLFVGVGLALGEQPER